MSIYVYDNKGVCYELQDKEGKYSIIREASHNYYPDKPVKISEQELFDMLDKIFKEKEIKSQENKV